MNNSFIKKLKQANPFHFHHFFAQKNAHTFDHTFSRLKNIRDLGYQFHQICDIGASNGQWTKKCMEIFPEASFFCIDPLDENESKLRVFTSQHAKVSFWKGGLAAQPGSAIMNIDGAGSSFLHGHTGNTYGIQRQIVLDTLDNLIQKKICPQPDFIKMDVQGYELEVMKGSENALKETQMVIAEVSFLPFQAGMPVFYDVIRAFHESGFALYDILKLATRPLDNAAGQTDLLFVKEDHPLRNDIRWDQGSIY